MMVLVVTLRDGETRTIVGQSGLSFMEAIRDAERAGLPHE